MPPTRMLGTHVVHGINVPFFVVCAQLIHIYKKSSCHDNRVSNQVLIWMPPKASQHLSCTPDLP